MVAAGCKVRREEKRAGHRATTCCTKSWRWARPEATRATRVAPIVVSSLHWRGVACGSATRNKPRQRRRFRVNRRYRCRDLLPSRLTGLPEVAVNFQQKSQKSRGATVSIAHFNKHTLVGKVRHSFGRVCQRDHLDACSDSPQQLYLDLGPWKFPERRKAGLSSATSPCRIRMWSWGGRGEPTRREVRQVPRDVYAGNSRL